MGRKSLIALIVGAVVLVGLAVVAYAVDSANSDTIADGVMVGDIDVGGLTEDQAREKLAKELVKPLEQPLVVRYNGDQFTLSKNDLAVTADVDGMVAEASAAGRNQSLPSRIWRYISGGSVDHQVNPQISYDEVAVDRFITGVVAKIDRKPQDATIEPSTTELSAVQGEPGRTLDEDNLRSQIKDALDRVDSGETPVVHPHVDRVKPDVTRADLGKKYPTFLTVDRTSYELHLFKDLKIAATYPIAVGMQGLETPAGLYTINDKTVNPTWYVPDAPWAGSLAGEVIPGGAPNNPLVARWLGFYNGAGIHGTNDVSSLGSSASHGCIRMDPDDVIELYDKVPLGTPIYIQ